MLNCIYRPSTSLLPPHPHHQFSRSHYLVIVGIVHMSLMADVKTSLKEKQKHKKETFKYGKIEGKGGMTSVDMCCAEGKRWTLWSKRHEFELISGPRHVCCWSIAQISWIYFRGYWYIYVINKVHCTKL